MIPTLARNDPDVRIYGLLIKSTQRMSPCALLARLFGYDFVTSSLAPFPAAPPPQPRAFSYRTAAAAITPATAAKMPPRLAAISPAPLVSLGGVDDDVLLATAFWAPSDDVVFAGAGALWLEAETGLAVMDE